jgi:type I restriction-modification system DNA methylase subunit
MSVTEDTVTNLISSYLQSQGISVRSQMTEKTSTGWVKPDFRIENGGVFFGEAKWESKAWKGFGEARDYGENIEGAEGSFVITYPDEIKRSGIQDSITGDIEDSSLANYKYDVAFLRRDTDTDMDTVSLEDLPEWIEENIKEQREPEQDPVQVIRVLRQMARRLNDELEVAPEENIFKNVLGAETDDQDEKQAARETAGFLLVNQITFYRVLSAALDEFDEIDPDDIESPSDLSDYFDEVLEMDYTPVFNFRIAEDLPDSSTSVLKDTIKSVYGISPERVDHDVLGKVFHELIPEEPRKKIAAYYTKNEPAQMLAELSLEDADANVLEPACGSGTLLSSSYRRKRELTSGFDESTHRQFIEEDLTGIDIMPFAAHLSCIHLALHAPVYQTDEVNIGITDSTGLVPGSTIDSLSLFLPDEKSQTGLAEYSGGAKPERSEEDYVEAGSTTMDATAGEEMELDYVDLVIMNPPFSRQEFISRFRDNYKDTLERRFDARSDYLHRKMSYGSYFFFLADKFLKRGGRIAAVIKSTILNIKSDRGVRKMLTEEYAIEYIFAREDAANYSEDTDLREILIIANKGKSEDDKGINYVLHDGPSVNDLAELDAVADTLEAGDSYEGDDYLLQKIDVETLNVNNLFSPLSLSNPELFSTYDRVANSLPLTSLDSLDVGLIRGIGSAGQGVMHVHPEVSINDPNISTYNADRDVWVHESESSDSVTAKHRHLGKTITVDKNDLVPNLRRPSDQPNLDLSNIPEYAVKNPNFDEATEWLKPTDESDIPNKWPSRVNSRMAHIALVRRVNVTAPGTHHLAYYSEDKRLFSDMMWVLPKATKAEAKILCAWFDSTFGWLKNISDRVETEGGWILWHRYIVREFRTPSLQKLDDKQQKALLDGFNDWKDEDTPPMYIQVARNANPGNFSKSELDEIEEEYEGLKSELGDGYEPRKKLDKAVMEAAGLDEEVQSEIFDEFYNDFLLELTSLKGMMGD